MPSTSHLFSFAALAAGLGVDTSLPSVRRAEHLLEAHVWTQVVQIDNTSAVSPYPRVVYALVFQLDSVLWFYTPKDGTQSLSLYRGQTEKDKANLGPLFVAIDPGFTHWTGLPKSDESPAAGSRLPNGCFIESMTLLFRELEKGSAVENPKLLSYYVSRPGGIRGHTVLQFTYGGKIHVIDPDRPTRPATFRHADPNDPKDVANRIRRDVSKARQLPLREFLRHVPDDSIARRPARGETQPVQPAAGIALHS
jgi:hypothetical protein